MVRRFFELVALVLLVTVAVLATVIVTRGPTKTTVKTALVPVATPRATALGAKVIDSHVCDPKDYVQGCALPTAPVSQIVRGVDPTAQGVDFGWSCPVSAAQSFGASYLSYDTSKDWTVSCVNSFHAAHKGTVAVWEAGANDATGGYSLGFSQAQRAAQELAALGAPASQPFDMAIDCDCAGSSLVSYFKGANAAEPGRINAYGGYDQVNYLSQQHLVGHLNWQTYAWSGGRWLPSSVAPLEQYLNSSAVDYDRAIAANYGQWPGPKPLLPLCSRTMCLTHFATACSQPVSFPAPCAGGIRGGPFVNHLGKVCSHGCDERQTVGEYQRLRPHWRRYHSTLLALRYRAQFLAQRLAGLIAHSTQATNRKLDRYDRAHILSVIGRRALYETNYNAYLKR